MEERLSEAVQKERDKAQQEIERVIEEERRKAQQLLEAEQVSRDDRSRVMRKPVFGVSNQVGHKLGCTATEDG